MATDFALISAAVLLLSLALITWGYATRLRDCHKPTPWRLSDRTTPLDPPPPPLDRRLWDGEVWTDPRDLMVDDSLEGSISRHPAGKGRR